MNKNENPMISGSAISLLVENTQKYNNGINKAPIVLFFGYFTQIKGFMLIS